MSDTRRPVTVPTAVYNRIVPEMHVPRIGLRRRLYSALVIAAMAAIIELVGSRLSGSLALLSDAGHVGTDAIAIGVSLWALWISERPHTPRMSFGYHRIEVLSSLANALLLLGIAAFLGVQAYNRALSPPPVTGSLMFLAGLAGLGANLLMLAILREPARQNINVRSAFLHAYGDTLGSIGVVVGAVLITTTGVVLFDVLIAVSIILLILVSAVRLLLDVVRILLEASPAGIRPEDIAREIESVEGVRGVHDLHVWTVTSGLYWLTGHIRVDGGTSVEDAGRIVERIQGRLKDRFGIAHATLQVDSVHETLITPSDIARGTGP